MQVSFQGRVDMRPEDILSVLLFDKAVGEEEILSVGDDAALVGDGKMTFSLEVSFPRTESAVRCRP